MVDMNRKNMTESKNGVLKDVLRVELENEQKRFFVQAFGSDHPLVKMQKIKAADARTRLIIRENRRTAQDIAKAISARKSEIGDLTSRGRITKEVDMIVDAVAEMKDEVDDFREAFTSSEFDDA